MSDEATHRPSARAVERLAGDVGNEVGDLRARLHRALDEADRLEAVGRQDLAAAVLDEQRAALLAVHERLQERLADAAVEREAELVLGAASAVSPSPDATASPAPAPAAPSGGDTGALRLLASAVAAALGIALLVTPELTGGGFTAAGTVPAERGPQQVDVESPAAPTQEESGRSPAGRHEHRSDAGGRAPGRAGPPAAAAGDAARTAASPQDDATEPEPVPPLAPWLTELAPLPLAPGLSASDDEGGTDDDDRSGARHGAEDGRAEEAADAKEAGDDETREPDARDHTADDPDADDDAGGADGSGEAGGDPADPQPAAVVPLPGNGLDAADGEVTDASSDGEADGLER